MTKNLDKSSIEHYLKDWLDYLVRCNEIDRRQLLENDEFYMPYAGAQPGVIRAVFIMSDQLNVEAQAKYLAVHLYDRYAGRRFMEIIRNAPENEDSIEACISKMTRLRENLAEQLVLDLACCLQIASKVDLFRTGIGISQVKDLLSTIEPDEEYDSATILSSEKRILRTLDFRIPPCLGIDAIELFLVYTKLDSTPRSKSHPQTHLHHQRNVRDLCLRLLDLAYLEHDVLFEHLHSLRHGKAYEKSWPQCRDFLAVLEASSVFIGASCVLASSFFLDLERKLVAGLAKQLVKVVHCDPADLHFMANLIFTRVMDEKDMEELRKECPPLRSSSGSRGGSRGGHGTGAGTAASSSERSRAG
ncbi:hypothetical protein QAD02_009149 [Eretmocerus hayati]|uniref:Uncharacterized protein n=1 Tax=Eretmocerus hayati TaxID=131215 RepID=A0ACC2N9A6_9HYME|nr:hypothetical protein QAD02_009149 [Eretmocerus hayati]